MKVKPNDTDAAKLTCLRSYSSCYGFLWVSYRAGEKGQTSGETGLFLGRADVMAHRSEGHAPSHGALLPESLHSTCFLDMEQEHKTVSRERNLY